MRFVFSLLIACLAAEGVSARAADAPAAAASQAASQAPAIKFQSLRFGKVRMHAGPGQQYPVAWVYQRKALPVQVLASYDVWRKIADSDGTAGWVQETMLADRRTAVVTRAERTLHDAPDPKAPAVALAEPGAIGEITACAGGWCHLKFSDYDGWLKQSEFWGAAPNESFGQ